MIIDCKQTQLSQTDLNRMIAKSKDSEIQIIRCLGQRYIGAGSRGKSIAIEGTPGNALGAYLDGTDIRVAGNAQDAVGDTMNDGTIVIDGNCGDAAGYAMRGGAIFIKGDVGYRAGIHMKEYRDKIPLLMIGGKAGSFLGEYQAGGVIIVLGLGVEDDTNVGYLTGTGMHGGKIVLRCLKPPADLPPQVQCREASREDLIELRQYLDRFCALFDVAPERLEGLPYYILTPDSANPYIRLYTPN